MTGKMSGQLGGNLLDHPVVRSAREDPATSFWLRDLLASAARRDPVDVLADLDAARALVGSYFDALTQGARLDRRPRQIPGDA